VIPAVLTISGMPRARAMSPSADASKQEQAQKGDEEHAKEMLDLLPKAFLFLNEAGLFAAVYGRESFTRDDRFHIGGSAASEIALP
jgi:hypothetical protein